MKKINKLLLLLVALLAVAPAAMFAANQTTTPIPLVTGNVSSMVDGLNQVINAVNAANFGSGGSSVTLTTTGNGGAATLTGSALNIPVYGTPVVSTITGNTNAAGAAGTSYVYFANCASACTLTLPTAVGNTSQYEIISIGAGTPTVNTTSSQTIAGLAGGPTTSVNIITQYSALTVIGNNANWFIE